MTKGSGPQHGLAKWQGFGGPSAQHGEVERRRRQVSSLFAEHGQRLTVKGDRVVPLNEGSDDSVILVVSGLLLAAIELPSDRRQVLGLHGPGSVVFCRTATLRSGIRYRAIRDGEIIVLNTPSLTQAQWTSQENLAALFAEATQQLQRVMLRTAAIGQCRSDEKLATFFLELALSIGQSSGESVAFDMPLRRDDIADYLGINRDTLSRTMSSFRQRGVIRNIRPGFVLARWDDLTNLTPLSALMLGSEVGGPSRRNVGDV
ncbi:MAG: Crp/Fnr family transcriptional regulator [Pseudomonadota bacterium]